jgi:alpha-ribazole phosphatase
MSAVRDRRLGRNEGATRLWWIRHAVVPAARGGRIAGQADLACDLSDGAAVEWLRGRLPGGPFTVVASPLRRAVETATAVTGRPPDETDPRLMEQDFGAWTQRPWTEVDGDAQALGFWADPVTAVPPGGESFAAQCARVAAWIDDARARHVGADLVVACHGGTVRAAIAHGLGLAPDAAAPVLRLTIDNLSLTRIDALQGGATAVLSINELSRRPS